ncbi:spermidine synthase [Couchioplanes caeruleus]|nr:fused MFS/spermidine synthase [Couchioplanes caeruleus]
MATHGNRRATIVARVDSGIATLEPDPARARGWTVCVDGVPQSYVDLGDPTHLAFEYVRKLATVLRVGAPAAVPLRILHLGGGGLTLPRWISATLPGAMQTVVEHDAPLLALVSRTLPWPPDVAVRVGEAREFVEGAAPGGYDVIITDVFQGAVLPASVATVGFAAAAARLLGPGGLLAMNLTDVPPLSHSRIQTATLRAAFDDVALIAAPGLLRGRRAGNVVLAAAAGSATLPVAALAAATARDPRPARVWHGAALTDFLGGAKARLDGYA